MKNLIKNLIYQFVYQVFKIALPLISVPIVSRSIGPDGLGIYNYYNSIVQYFVLVTSLGLPLYGTKLISQTRHDEILQTKNFWQLETISLFLMTVFGISSLVMGIMMRFPPVFFVQLLLVVSAGLDVSWFFRGIENFKISSLVNMLVGGLSVVFIVLFVRHHSDLFLYGLITSFFSVAAQIPLWALLVKYLKKINVKYIFNIFDLKKHVLGMVTLFTPQIGIVVYTNLNKTMLGAISEAPNQLAFFANSILVTSTLVTLISTVDNVILPRAALKVANGETAKISKILVHYLSVQASMTLPVSFGLAALAPVFVPLFFGHDFTGMIPTFEIASFLVFAIPFGMSISIQYLVPMSKMKEYNVSVFTGAGLSILLNAILIPKFLSVGAAIVSVSVELFIAGYRLYSFQKAEHVKISYVSFAKYVVSGVIMYISVAVSQSFLPGSWPTLMLLILIGIVVYFAMLGVLRVLNPEPYKSMNFDRHFLLEFFKK